MAAKVTNSTTTKALSDGTDVEATGNTERIYDGNLANGTTSQTLSDGSVVTVIAGKAYCGKRAFPKCAPGYRCVDTQTSNPAIFG